MNKRIDRIKGALYGVVLGDALGAPLEFMTQEEIRRRHGGKVKEMIGGGWLDVEPGEITDDTQMTLAVAQGIVANPENPIEGIGQRFIDWISKGPKDVGGTCAMSIRQAARRSQEGPNEEMWKKASKNTATLNRGRSGGNGALMRAVYPGLYYSDLGEAENIAARQAEMTHRDNLSTHACILYTEMIRLLTEGGKGKEVIEQVARDNKLIMALFTLEAGEELRPTGYVVDSFKCALWSIATTESAEDAIVEAANLGGDADTIAAIAGGLAGAIYGYNQLPNRWIQELDPETKKELDRLAEAAVENRKER